MKQLQSLHSIMLMEERGRATGFYCTMFLSWCIQFNVFASYLLSLSASPPQVDDINFSDDLERANAFASKHHESCKNVEHGNHVSRHTHARHAVIHKTIEKLWDFRWLGARKFLCSFAVVRSPVTLRVGFVLLWGGRWKNSSQMGVG